MSASVKDIVESCDLDINSYKKIIEWKSVVVN